MPNTNIFRPRVTLFSIDLNRISLARCKIKPRSIKIIHSYVIPLKITLGISKSLRRAISVDKGIRIFYEELT